MTRGSSCKYVKIETKRGKWQLEAIKNDNAKINSKKLNL